jgi:hypothetical protein
MPQGYAVGWPKFERSGLEDAKTESLKVGSDVPIVELDQMLSLGRFGCEL